MFIRDRAGRLAANSFLGLQILSFFFWECFSPNINVIVSAVLFRN
jgi:hypothetical protein